MDSATTRCGVITLAGKPNAGKSTLLNRLVGEPLAITSHKAQTTRLPVMGLVTTETTQLLIVDPAGLFQPEYLLQQGMIDAAAEELRHADAIVYLHPVGEGPPPPLSALLPVDVAVHQPVLTVLSRADEGSGIEPTGDQLAVSAKTGAGIDELLAWCCAHVPQGPFRYDPEDLSTQPARFFVAEFVREAALRHLEQELPYALVTDVDEFREGSDPLYIRVVLYVERESQKGMVVGKAGRTIKAVGQDARRRIEAFLGERVYLDLWVKTLPKWRARAAALRRFGFTVSPKGNP